VLKGGQEHPLFDDTRIDVDFNHRDDYDVVTWQADCNLFGARVEVTEQRLVAGQIEGTHQGCAKRRRARQDRWLVRFFDADPKWRIRRNDRLKLTAGDRVIRLRRPKD
jgi:heat shock protein HslJ